MEPWQDGTYPMSHTLYNDAKASQARQSLNWRCMEIFGVNRDHRRGNSKTEPMDITKRAGVLPIQRAFRRHKKSNYKVQSLSHYVWTKDEGRHEKRLSTLRINVNYQNTVSFRLSFFCGTAKKLTRYKKYSLPGTEWQFQNIHYVFGNPKSK